MIDLVNCCALVLNDQVFLRLRNASFVIQFPVLLSCGPFQTEQPARGPETAGRPWHTA